MSRHWRQEPQRSVLALVGRDIEGREQFAEKEPGAVLAGDEVGVLALPADAGPRRQRLLHHRRRVHEELHLGAEGIDDEACEAPEPALDHVVVVAALGVGRNDAPRRHIQQTERIVCRAVVDADHHDAARLGPERAGGRAPLGGARQPTHVPGIAEPNELLERSPVPRCAFGARHAHRLEPKRACLGEDRVPRF